jgi:hypothetical protein
VAFARADGDRRARRRRGPACRHWRNRFAPAVSPTRLAAVSGLKPGSDSSCGEIWAISASSALIACQSSRCPAQLVTGDPHAHGLLGTREPRGDRKQRAARPPQFGPRVAQTPLQRGVERNTLADEALAMAAADRVRGLPAARPAAHRGVRAAPPGRRRSLRCGRTCHAHAPGAASRPSARPRRVHLTFVRRSEASASSSMSRVLRRTRKGQRAQRLGPPLHARERPSATPLAGGAGGGSHGYAATDGSAQRRRS